MKKLALTTALVVTSSLAFPAALFFNAQSAQDNAATRNAWLAAIGISQGEHFQDFESFDIGTNLHGVPLDGGLTVTHTSNNAFVRGTSNFFGSSNPIDTRALALAEGANALLTLTFASAVDYVGGYDIDNPGGPLTVFFADNTSEFINLETTASSGDSAEFWGVYRNDKPGIVAVTIRASGGDGQWGLDNLEYGVVPEPATMTLLGLGALAALRRKKSK